jgi:hypothetical protein
MKPVHREAEHDSIILDCRQMAERASASIAPDTPRLTAAHFLKIHTSADSWEIYDKEYAWDDNRAPHCRLRQCN